MPRFRFAPLKPDETCELSQNGLLLGAHRRRTAWWLTARNGTARNAPWLGAAIKAPDGQAGETTMKGVVQALHFARHGEPNGVILETGEFIHLRPHGMVAAGLDIGSKVTAVGELRMTVLGTRMLEARRVNRVDLA
jgi:hypothetical protein